LKRHILLVVRHYLGYNTIANFAIAGRFYLYITIKIKSASIVYTSHIQQ
jgi:hypothetical protein